MTRLALPAPSPEREMEHAERTVNQAFEAWHETEPGSSESQVRYAAYLDAIQARERVFVTEARE